MIHETSCDSPLGGAGEGLSSPEQSMPLVSVLMLVYNHEEFIEQAVCSVLDQKCDFPFEIVMGDDASTDGTLSRLRSLEQRYPGKLRILSSDRNLGITGNFLRTLEACHGEYIAMLEGDDYWVDKRKLQDQVAQLNSDPSLALSACRTKNRTFWAKAKERYTLTDLLRRYLFHTSALVFRKSCMSGFPVRPDVVALDSLLVAHLAKQGDCGFIDREMSYYRRHAAGAWSGTEISRKISNTQAVTNSLSQSFAGRYDSELFDRELWIYGMMTNVRLDHPVLPQWKEVLRLLRPLLTRTLRYHPAGSLKNIFRILLIPVTAGLSRLRRAVGFRTRWRLFRSRAVLSKKEKHGEAS